MCLRRRLGLLGSHKARWGFKEHSHGSYVSFILFQEIKKGRFVQLSQIFSSKSSLLLYFFFVILKGFAPIFVFLAL